jgi:hypothetical protein
LFRPKYIHILYGVSRAQISGPKEMYIKAGSELRLACRVDLGPDGPDEHYRYLVLSLVD